MKIILGSANFQNQYGILKTKINENEVKKISDYAFKNYICTIDTAESYSAENLIRSYFRNFTVHTKFLILKRKKKEEELFLNIKNHLFVLKKKTKKIDVIYFHNVSDIYYLKKKKILQKVLLFIKKELKIKNIGVSFYNIEDVKKVLSLFIPDYAQIPVNILDNRFLKKSILKSLRENSIKIVVRSCFLQGLLLKKKLKFGSIKSKRIFNDFVNWCNNNRLSQLEACILFIKNISEVDFVIFGTENKKQLQQIVNILNYKKNYVFKLKPITEKKVIDPRNWS